MFNDRPDRRRSLRIVPATIQEWAEERRDKGVIIFDAAFRYVFVNKTAEKSIPRPRNEIIGKSAWDVFPELVGTPTEAAMRKAACAFTPTSYDTVYHGRVYRAFVVPAPNGGMLMCFREIDPAESKLDVKNDLAAIPVELLPTAR